MGLANKLATKVRTKARSAPVVISGPWPTYGQYVAAAIMRAVAATLGSEHLRSSAFRGRDVWGMHYNSSSGDSIVWLDQSSPIKFSIGIGQRAINYGRVLDWQLDFTFSDGPEGRYVDVITPAVSTTNGTQIHKDQYSEIRDLVLTGLSTGTMPNPNAELAASQAGLQVTSAPVANMVANASRRRTIIDTALTPPQVHERVSMLPFPEATTGQTEVRRFGVAADGGDTEHYTEVSIAVKDGHCRVECTVDIPLVNHPVIDMLHVLRAHSITETIFTLLYQLDPATTLKIVSKEEPS